MYACVCVCKLGNEHKDGAVGWLEGGLTDTIRWVICALIEICETNTALTHHLLESD